MIPTIDLDAWRAGAADIAPAADAALRQAGFLLITGHGWTPGMPAELRAAARRFFA